MQKRPSCGLIGNTYIAPSKYSSLKMTLFCGSSCFILSLLQLLSLTILNLTIFPKTDLPLYPLLFAHAIGPLVAVPQLLSDFKGILLSEQGFCLSRLFASICLQFNPVTPCILDILNQF